MYIELYSLRSIGEHTPPILFVENSAYSGIIINRVPNIQLMLVDKRHTRSPVEPTTSYSHEFWENYTLFLVKQGITQTYVTWYVLRTKQYIAYFPDDHIRTHTPQQVEEFLNKVGCEVNLKAWQFGQVVDAILILFCLALKKVGLVSFID